MVRADLEADAAALLRPDWLAAQRWYGANDRQLTSVRLTAAAQLPAAPGQVTTGSLLVITVAFADGDEARYLIPAIRDGDRLREPRDREGVWSGVAAAILDGAVIPASAGAFQCESSDPTSVALGDEHRLGVEQTNTSVLLGEELILKLYRRLQDGVNPEIEVGAFLETVGCDVVPRMIGSMQYIADAPAAAAILQQRVMSSMNAWEEIGSRLRGDGGGPDAAVEAAAAIGRVTARLHTGFAARPEDVAFPVRAAHAEEIEAWHAAANSLIERASEAARLEDGRLFASMRSRLDAAFGGMHDVRVMRIHGDYHLGQLLKTADGYAVIDFEGEPARPLAERRAPQSPERDVAGMLRSFDYAARTEQRRTAGSFDADAWLARARDAFLSAYRETAPSPPDVPLLDAFELEKLCYEITYEAANRPEWLWLPVEAATRLVVSTS